jgi:hypothetical protein
MSETIQRSGDIESRFKELKDYYHDQYHSISTQISNTVNLYVGSHMDHLAEMVENYYTDLSQKQHNILKGDFTEVKDYDLLEKFKEFYDDAISDDVLHMGTLLRRALHNGIVTDVDLRHTVASLKKADYAATKVLEKYFDVKLDHKRAGGDGSES